MHERRAKDKVNELEGGKKGRTGKKTKAGGKKEITGTHKFETSSDLSRRGVGGVF